jgi:hypothetical protein
MNEAQDYPIGTTGQSWGDNEKTVWLALQTIKRPYADEVLEKLEQLNQEFIIEQYGALAHRPDRYPLFALRSKNWNDKLPNVLITGGVHGYETSGVQGAIRFLETHVADYAGQFNFVAAPCVSPWGYETINRWNPSAVDPNRSFRADSPAQEAELLMRYLQENTWTFAMHIDLHETTDTDNDEFRPALAARDAVIHDNWHIPDGFYTVGDTDRPEPEFQKAVIRSVEQVTHIAPPDENGKIIGEEMQHWGVIDYAAKPLGLCMGLTDARFVTTTEVYPDSPKVDDENCIIAQVAAVTGGLDYILKTLS